MGVESPDSRVRLLLASFSDGQRGGVWRERLGTHLRMALDLLHQGLSAHLPPKPDEWDRQHVEDLLRVGFPGRLGGQEAWAPEVPDLLEDVLLHVAEEEGIARQWDWTSAVQAARDDFERALLDPDRPRFAIPSHPDRRPASKLGRNEPCPCGSGKKYKHCCL